MTNDSVEQGNSRLSTCKASVCSLTVALGYIFIATSLILFIFTILGFSTKDSNSTITTAASGIVLLIVGVTLGLLVHLNRGSKVSASQVVISAIPAEDLAKSPVPSLPYNHILRRQPFAEVSAVDLPDYFTAVRGLNEVHLSMDVAVCTDVFPENFAPPPCYEEALIMASMDTEESKLHSSSKFGDGENKKLNNFS